jgi:integrase
MQTNRDLDKLTWNHDVLRENRPGNHSFGDGLYLRVGPNGRNGRPRKTWIFRYRYYGVTKKGKAGFILTDMGLGSIKTFNLAEVRAKVRKLRQELDAFRHGDGPHPMEVRKAAKQKARIEAATTRTFRQCADEYIAGRTWANLKHSKQWPATLATYVYPKVGELSVRAITTPLVIDVLKPIWNEKPETASRVRQRIEAVLGWATVHGYREGDNPARWQNHLSEVFQHKSEVRKVRHHAALPYGEVAVFMSALREQLGTGARALEFAILTAARTGEVIGARWREINLAERLWVVPAERMKAGKEHRVPLSDAAMAALGTPGDGEQFVFPGARRGTPLSNMALLRTLRRMGSDATAHGFRSTFMDWATEQTHFPAEVREMALAHTVSDKVEAAYRRGDLFDRRRRLMDDWARWCAGVAVGGEVVALHAS